MSDCLRLRHQPLDIKRICVKLHGLNIVIRPGTTRTGNSSGERKTLSKKIYVGNLSFDATEQQVRDLFSEFGAIESIAMINDRDSGRFRGFAFVEMETSAANAAIKALNGKEVDGRALNVNEARPREERSNYGGGQRSGGSNYRRNDYSNKRDNRGW